MEAALDEQIREAQAAMNQNFPDQRAAIQLRISALNIQKGNLAAAELAQQRALRDQERADEAQANWEPTRLSRQREQARNDAWRRWWAHECGYSSENPQPREKPTVVQVASFDVPMAVIPAQSSNECVPDRAPRRHISCFAAGTLVQTRTGSRPIEELKLGDLVLSRDPATGALEYQPITAVHHRQPSPTYRIVLGGETIIATGIHRFWKAGAGWMMARDLKPGDPIRAIDGIQTVESVQADEVRPVFNLDVDRTRNFLVGRAGILVHDDRLPDPVTAPFDAVPELVAARAK